MGKHSDSQLRDKIKENPFPIESTDPKEKSKDSYGENVAKYIYFRGLTEDVSSNRRVVAQENRDYGANRNDINKFKPLLDAEIDNQGDTSYINIDWSNQHPGMKFTNIIIGDMINQDYKIQFNAIDKYSKEQARKARDDFYGQIVRKQDIAEMESESGLVLEDRGDFIPSSKEEVDIYMDMEFKQAIEIGMETIVDFELENNLWEKKVRNRVVRDFVENNIGAVRLEFNKNNEISLRYVDAPMDLYTSFTDEPDFSNVEYQAERVFMSIRDLRMRDINNKVTEKQWFKIARDNASQNGNGEWRFGRSYSPDHTYSGMDYSYNDYRVECLDFVFYSVDLITYAEKEDRYGNKHTEKKPFGYKKPKKSDKIKEVIHNDMEMSYEGIWVVDSDIMVGYGQSRNILRPKTDKAITPRLLHRYIVFEPNIRGGRSKSLVEVMKPNLDTIQILILKKRHLIAEMNPTGIAVDVTGMTDVLAALKETDPMKIIKLYKQKGIMFFARTDINGDPANGLPVQELNNPFAENLIALDNSIIAEIEHIRQNTGINDTRDGSSPDKDALVGIEKMRLLASNNVTRELYKGYINGVFSPIGQVMARMIQYKVEYGNGIKEYENIIGELGVKAVEFAKNITMAQLGIIVEALPTDDQIQDLLDMLTISLKSKEIRPEDVLEIKRMKNVKKGERLLKYKRKVYAKEQMNEFAQKEQITGEREKNASIAAAEAEKIRNASKVETEVAILEAEYSLKERLSDKDMQNQLKILDKEGYLKEILIEKQQEGDKESVDKPKVMQDPSSAAERQADVSI